MPTATQTDNSLNTQLQKWVFIASLVILLLYVLSGIGHYFPEYLPITGLLITPNIARELGVVELSEVVLWFAAMVFFAKLALTKESPNVSKTFKFWCVLFAIFSFVALGEESSWGQHLGLIQPPEHITDLNAQKEFNFHNLKAATLLGVSESHFLYPYLNSRFGASALLNPLFYAFCGFVWVFIPFLKRKNLLNKIFLMNDFPIAAPAISWFVGLNLLSYLIVDKGFFDVAECLELAMAIAALLVSKNLFDRVNKQSQSVASSSTT